ncbi:MAG: asparaginase [Saprospiraceae bacterium]|nr:asparaginase [Saprospiraceae bacterium]
MLAKDEEIRIFATGGTFDKEYNELNGQLFFKDTHLYEMLNRGRNTVKISIRTLMMLDSLDMTNVEREVILQSCKRAAIKKIIITHGTDTMITTAKLLQEHITDKTVILTGALIPYAFGTSDGFFNLGNAIAYAQILPPGVYIVMNGKYFKPENVRKDYTTGFFERLE